MSATDATPNAAGDLGTVTERGTAQPVTAQPCSSAASRLG